MSFIEMSLTNVVKRQFRFKLKAYSGMFGTLVIMQLIGLVFSLLGPYQYSGYGLTSATNVSFHYYSTDVVILFTMLWAFISALLITTKATRYDDFAFITNRMSSLLANILFLFAAGAVGGISAILCSYIVKIFYYFTGNIEFMSSSPGQIFIGFVAATLYVFLFSAFGYLIGAFIQMSKLFIIIFPALFIGMIAVGVPLGQEEKITAIYHFFASESSLLLFALKIIIVSGLCFVCSAAILNRMEVRK
ncbi:hypothetical protein [Bacillus sp. FJAT-50079]|uniref:hypothetical protein n=1 Tax=Bacillus sp. FJAT-50079 TaxID=2833577 RepID=UPI001BC9204A|nr:hypothetical protein [Bacillus sp. FJAT-50079]MBS4210144.1 hypothetical protein [Bacillus sp. FJAT-50079]